MNTKKKEMSIAVLFLAAAIIFVSSTPLTNFVSAQSHDGEDNPGNMYYENFLNCLSDAGGSNSYPAGDQIVNCFVESGYIQGSSSTINSDDTEDESENVDVSVVGDESDEETENVDVSVVGDESDAAEDEDAEDEDAEDEDAEDEDAEDDDSDE